MSWPAWVTWCRRPVDAPDRMVKLGSQVDPGRPSSSCTADFQRPGAWDGQKNVPVRGDADAAAARHTLGAGIHPPDRSLTDAR